jgi:hypothetical protein
VERIVAAQAPLVNVSPRARFAAGAHRSRGQGHGLVRLVHLNRLLNPENMLVARPFAMPLLVALHEHVPV